MFYTAGITRPRRSASRLWPRIFLSGSKCPGPSWTIPRACSPRAPPLLQPFAPEAVLFFGVAVTFGKAAAVVCRSRENEDDAAIAVAPWVEAELVVRRNVLGNVVQVELPLFILVEAQAIAGVKVVDDNDRVLALFEDDGHFVPERPEGSPMGVEEEYGLLPNLREMRAEKIRRGLGLVGQVVRKVDFRPALPVYHITGEDLLKEQAHGQGSLAVVGAGLYEIAQAEVGLKLLNDTDEARVDNDAATEVIMQVSVEALGVLAELLPKSVDFSGGQLAGFPFLDLVVDEPVEQRLPHRRLLEHFQHRECSRRRLWGNRCST